MRAFNLVTDPWVPAIIDGRSVTVGLRDLFSEADRIQDLSLRPHERIAVTRLLLCVAHAALDGPADRREWSQCRDRIAVAAGSYLSVHQHEFNLFGDGKRFLQVPNLTPADSTPVSKLASALATRHNPTLFDSAGGEGRVFAPAMIARSLVTEQSFCACGTIGSTAWNGNPTSGNSNQAPCSSGSMLHTLIVGETLLETLHFNLLTKHIVKHALGPDRWGRPVWELMPESLSDTAAVWNATHTYLGRLVPIARAIRLNPDCVSMTYANGLDYSNEYRESMATIIRLAGGKERAPLWASLDRASWRQLHAITVRRLSSGIGGPLALENLDGDESVTLWTGALVSKQASPIDTVESAYMVPRALFDPSGQKIYSDGVKHSEDIAWRLWLAVQEYHKQLGDKLDRPENKQRRELLQRASAAQYWTLVEQSLPLLFALVNDPTETRWKHAVRTAAIRAYESACPNETSRQMRAFVQGRQQLFNNGK